MAIEGYDLVMLGILAAAAVLGYFKGMVWQLAWIAGIAVSGFLALRFSGPLAPMFGQQAPWNRLIAMLAIYVGTSLAVWLVFRVISGAINAIHLSAFDHQLGLLLGLAKGALVCIVVTFFAVTLAPGYRGQIVASRSGRLVAELIMRADELLPPNVVEPVQPFVKQFEDQFRLPAAGSNPPAPTAVAQPQPSALKAIWESMTTASAWTNQGAVSAGAVPAGAGPGQGGQAMPVGFTAPSAWGGPPPMPAAPVQPARPATSGFPNRPAFPAPQPAPGQFPVGAQSPISIR